MRDWIAQTSLLGGLLIAGAYLSAAPSLPWAALASALAGATLCVGTILAGALWDRLVPPAVAPELQATEVGGPAGRGLDG